MAAVYPVADGTHGHLAAWMTYSDPSFATCHNAATADGSSDNYYGYVGYYWTDAPFPPLPPNIDTYALNRMFFIFDTINAPTMYVAGAALTFTVPDSGGAMVNKTVHAVLYHPVYGFFDPGLFPPATDFGDIQFTSGGSVTINQVVVGETEFQISLSDTVRQLISDAVNGGHNFGLALIDDYDLNNTDPGGTDGGGDIDGRLTILHYDSGRSAEKVWLTLTPGGPPTTTFSFSDNLLSGSDSTMDYSLDNGDTWTNCDTDTDLSAFLDDFNVDYGILVRYTGDSNSDNWQIITIEILTSSFDFDNGNLYGLVAGRDQVSFDGGGTWWSPSTNDANIWAYQTLRMWRNGYYSDDFGATWVAYGGPFEGYYLGYGPPNESGIWIRMINHTNIYQIVSISRGPGAPEVSFTQRGQYAYILRGSTTDMQYSFDGFTWTAVTGTNMDMSAVDFGSHTSFWVRYTATGSTASGAAGLIFLDGSFGLTLPQLIDVIRYYHPIVGNPTP